MGRLLHLYLLWWLGLSHRLRHDLARELTFAIASCVLIATFFYVFNDFLNVQVAALSAAMHQRFAKLASIALLLLTGARAATWLRHERFAATGVRQMARHLGEKRTTLQAWSWLYTLTLTSFSHGLCWWIIHRYLTPWSLPQAALFEAMLLVTTALVVRWPAAPQPAMQRDSALERDRSLGLTLYLWRLRQIVGRNRASQFALILSTMFLLLVALAAMRTLPLFVAALCSLAAGYTSTAALIFHLADDLPSAWTERGSGVTHDRFVTTYFWLGATLAGAYALAASCAYLSGTAALGGGELGIATIGQALQLAAVAIVPGLTAPMLCMQIDGRRSGINLLLLLIAALFVGTAVFAHWLGLGLIPVLGSFALKSQAGRFYRA
ncbi:MAG: hypothetical protein NTZ90_18315 [Proteobacteria bacterium]|nr:hypothetical protein [Pseudomonadota bacterium]